MLFLFQIALVSASTGSWDWCSGSNPCQCEDGWYPAPASFWTWWCYPCGAGTATMTSAGGVGVHSCTTSPVNTWSEQGWGMPHYCPAGQVSPAGSTTSGACQACAENTIAVIGSAVCAPCPRGMNSTSSSTACSLCPSGYGYDANLDNLGCVACPIGQVSLENGHDGTCTTCADNYYPDEASSSCLKCSAGFYSKAGFDESGKPGCSSCPSGKISTAGGSCVDCSQGTFEVGRTSCSACPDGTWSKDGDSYCSITCEPNYYLDLHKTCQACGYDTQSTNGTACTKCPAGFGPASTGIGCEECGQGSASLHGICMECPSNTKWISTSECQACPSGQISDGGMSECVCPAHLVMSPVDGSCKPCPLDQFVNSTTLTCQSCAANQYVDHADETCHFCPDNHVLNGTTTQCVACLAGFQSKSGDSNCTSCNVGMISKSGESCHTCPLGEASNDDFTRCIACPKNTFSNGTGCKPCPDNKYSVPGSISCAPCPKNHYFDLISRDCLTCKPGSISNGTDSKCNLCPLGQTSDHGNDCHDCLPGTFAVQNATSTCQKCPSGKSCAGKTNPPVKCLSGDFSKAGSANCQPCLNNTFSTGSHCYHCGNGTTHVNEDRTGCDCRPGYAHFKVVSYKGGKKGVCTRVKVSSTSTQAHSSTMAPSSTSSSTPETHTTTIPSSGNSVGSSLFVVMLCFALLF